MDGGLSPAASRLGWVSQSEEGRLVSITMQIE